MRHLILAIFKNKYILKHIITKWNILLAVHNVSELKNIANNAKIRHSLKFLRNGMQNV